MCNLGQVLLDRKSRSWPNQPKLPPAYQVAGWVQERSQTPNLLLLRGCNPTREWMLGCLKPSIPKLDVCAVAHSGLISDLSQDFAQDMTKGFLSGGGREKKPHPFTHKATKPHLWRKETFLLLLLHLGGWPSLKSWFLHVGKGKAIRSRIPAPKSPLSAGRGHFHTFPSTLEASKPLIPSLEASLVPYGK